MFRNKRLNSAAKPIGNERARMMHTNREKEKSEGLRVQKSARRAKQLIPYKACNGYFAHKNVGNDIYEL